MATTKVLAIKKHCATVWITQTGLMLTALQQIMRLMVLLYPIGYLKKKTLGCLMSLRLCKYLKQNMVVKNTILGHVYVNKVIVSLDT